MNLIDKYVAEVGKHLPLLKGRKDVEQELKSTLEDMLEDRAQATGRPRDEALTLALLKEYGSPQKIASSYNPHPYLIGPRMFPLFLMVLKIVVAVVVTVLLVLAGFRAVTLTPSTVGELMQVIGEGFGGALSAAVAAFGNVVLVFAILERYLPEKAIGGFSEDEAWDPAALAAQPDPDEIKRGELIVELVFTFIGLAFLYGFFRLPLFTDEFAQFIPWLSATLFAEIALNIYLLSNGMWNTLARVGKVLIEAASLAITFILFRTPGLTLFTNESLLSFVNFSEEISGFVLLANYAFKVALIIVLIIQGIELAKALYGLLRINYRTN